MDRLDTFVGSQPVEGWRAWRLVRSDDHGPIGLASLFSPHERWAARSAPRATCAVEGSYHTAPSPNCRCGYYAYAERARLAGSSRRVGVVGTVSMWGSVIDHDFGFRGEFAYPQRLRLVCGRCLRAGRDRAARWVVERRGGELVSVCGRHAPRVARRSRRTPAPVVQAELLASYAVEVLPPTDLPRIPVRTRVARSFRSVLGARASIGQFLCVVLVAGIGAWALSARGGDGPPPDEPTGQVRLAALPPIVKTRSTHADRPSPVRYRYVCGAGAARHIHVVACSTSSLWVSSSVYRAGIEPTCAAGQISLRMPDGRHRCWLQVTPPEA